MHFIKRGILQILRTPVKSLVLLLIVTLIGSLMMGALSVVSVFNATHNNLMRQIAPVVSIVDDWQGREQAWYEAGGEYGYVYDEEWGYGWGRIDFKATELPSLETAERLAALPYVDSFYLYSRFWTYTDLVPFGRPASPIGSISITNPITGYVIDVSVADNAVELQGTSNEFPLLMTNGIIDLVEGSGFAQSKPNGLLISRNLAQENELEIGSTVLFPSYTFYSEERDFERIYELVSQPSFVPEDLVKKRVEHHFEVVGIFEPALDFDAYSYNPTAERNRINHLDNLIFTTTMSLQNIWAENSYSDLRLDFAVNLYDPTDINAFRLAAAPYLPDFWVVEDLTGNFQPIMTAFAFLTEVAYWMLVGSIIGGVTVISLIIMLFLKDRRHEIGIYMALGEKNWRILTQIFLEVILITLISLILAAGIGSVLSSQISQIVLKHQISVTPIESSIPGWQFLDRMGLHQTMSSEAMLANLDTSLNSETIVMFVGMGIVTVIISTVLPISYVLRLKPKKILM